jgi:hypothetical protein
VAHVTASNVYSALKREGLIVVRPGRGTYVAGSGAAARRGKRKAELHRLVDAMVTRALKSGYRPAEISHMVTARLASGQARRPHIALVGVFSHATAVYARDIAALLSDLAADVVPYTIDDIRTGGDNVGARIQQADVVLTVANRVKEVQDLLGPEAPCVEGLAFVAHPETIARLRALPRALQLGVVSTFAEFLPTMVHSIMQAMSLRQPPMSAVLTDTARVGAVLAAADAIVYASGSEAVLAQVRPGILAIEYLHTPEPSSVEAVRPLLERFSGLWTGHNQHSRNGRWNPDRAP